MESIKQKILPLPDNTTIYSGHGPKTILGMKRKKILSLLEKSICCKYDIQNYHKK